MEEFGYRGAYKFQGFWTCLHPIVALVALGALYFLLVAPGMAQFQWWVPLAAIGIVAWLVWDLAGAFKRLRFRVRLCDASIQVGDGPEVTWQDVERAEFGAGFGKDAVITLHTKSGSKVCIPAAIESLPYIQGVVRKHVASLTEPG